MKNIRRYVKAFYQQESKAYLLLVGFLLTALIYLNYRHGLESKYVGGHDGWIENFIGYYLMYFLVFAIAFFLQIFFHKERNLFKARWFWIILFLAPALFSLRVNLQFFYKLLPGVHAMGEEFSYSFDLFIKTVGTIIPIYFIWKIKDSTSMEFYGTRRLKDLSPYWKMLLFMVPLVALASTQHDFLQKYPRAHILPGMPVDKVNDLWQLIIYELSYGFNFLSIELFFRGFLVLALLKYCGTRCIIPIACFYVSIHMGKPMGEAISSFFGGALLGIVTYHTRSIWGGLIVHLGIAWLMEIGGAVGRYLAF